MNPAAQMMFDKLSELASRGMTYQQAADEIGATYPYVYHFSRRYSIPLSAERRPGRPAITDPDARSETMRDRYQAGETLEQIGQSYGITRERVRQLIRKYFGLRAKDGGQAERARKARKEFQRKRDARALKAWGCTYREYKRILKHEGQPTYAYWQQRRNAIERGIGWEFNLWQWWKTWEQSGHWPERGNGKGYCMCRLNDVGPYAADNVYIATGTDNMLDHWVKKRAAKALQVAA